MMKWGERWEGEKEQRKRRRFTTKKRRKRRRTKAARSKPKSLFLRSSPFAPFLRCESSWFFPWWPLPYQPLSALSVILVTLVRSFEHVAILLAEHQRAVQPDRYGAVGE